MTEILQREAIYLWYYFSLQLEQILGFWILGMVLGSAISVFLKDSIHRGVRLLGGQKIGVLGIGAASALGIASPLCMYGTIPIAASFSRSGVEDDWLAAFMISSILLNPQLIIYSAGLAWDTADVLMGCMALINVPVCIILGNTAFKALKDYTKKKKSGESLEFKAADIGVSGTEYWK